MRSTSGYFFEFIWVKDNVWVRNLSNLNCLSLIANNIHLPMREFQTSLCRNWAKIWEKYKFGQGGENWGNRMYWSGVRLVSFIIYCSKNSTWFSGVGKVSIFFSKYFGHFNGKRCIWVHLKIAPWSLWWFEVTFLSKFLLFSLNIYNLGTHLAHT